MPATLDRATVLKRLADLDRGDRERRVFGASSHEYRLNPPLPVAERYETSTDKYPTVYRTEGPHGPGSLQFFTRAYHSGIYAIRRIYRPLPAILGVEAGDHQWFTRPLIDSYHTVWFELHEDLLSTLGKERASEESKELA